MSEHALDMELDLIHVWCGWHMRYLGQDQNSIYFYQCPKCGLTIALAPAELEAKEEQPQQQEEVKEEKKEKKRRKKKKETNVSEPIEKEKESEKEK